MSTQENTRIVHRFYEEVVNGHDLGLLDDIVAADVVEHYAPPEQARGSKGLKDFLTMIGTAFPDLRVTVEDIIADGEKVVARLTLRGTHQGEFFGIQPTGRSVEWRAIHIVRVDRDKIAERWALADVIGIMAQVGAIPAPGT